MNDYQEAEWKQMVSKAKHDLKSSCPLIEDEVIVSVADLIEQQQQRIAELEAHNKELDRLNDEYYSLYRKVFDKRNQLAATVERLRDALVRSQDWNWIEAKEDNEESGRDFFDIHDMQELYEIAQSTPQQNLNAVKREVAREAYIKGYCSAAKSYEFGWDCGLLSTTEELVQQCASSAHKYANTKYPSGKDGG